jgi:hypothetical protein
MYTTKESKMHSGAHTRSYPSIIAPIVGPWREASDGIQFEYQGRRVGVGRLVQEEQILGHKKVNLACSDLQFEQLLIAAAMDAGAEGEIALVLGFPRLTFEANRNIIAGWKDRTFAYETPRGPRSFTLRAVWPLYEAVGHAVGLQSALNIHDTLAVASLGFGTVEAVVVAPSGKPYLNTLFGEKLGIRRAAERLKKRLTSLGIRTADHEGTDAWYDQVLVKGYHEHPLVIRVASGILSKADLKKLVDETLEKYAQEDLAPRLFEHLEDTSPGGGMFAVTGGGSLYEPVRRVLLQMARDLGQHVHEVPSHLALESAARGYEFIARTRAEFSTKTLVADFGNSQTVYAWML